MLLAAFALACVALGSAHALTSANRIAESAPATPPPPERAGLALPTEKGLADVSAVQTPYFTLVANAVPSMQAVYDTMGGSIVSHIAAVDLNGDGKDDMAIHFWKFAIGSTPVTNVPCVNRLMLLVQQPNGTFVDRTSTYLTGAADLGACSLGHVVVDVNGDGRQDVVYSTSQEDGRDTTDPNVANAQIAILMSGANDTYTIEKIGSENWYHQVGYGYDVSSRLVLGIAGYTGPSEVWRRNANSTWTNVSSDFPELSANGFSFSNDTGLATPSNRLVENAKFPDILELGGAYLDGAQTWQAVSNLHMFDDVGSIHMTTWTGQTVTTRVFQVDDLFVTSGSFLGACSFRMAPGAPESTVLKLSVGAIPGGYAGPEQLVSENDLIPYTRLIAARIAGGQLERVPLPIAGERSRDVNANFHVCKDFNADGYMDIAMFPYGNKGRPFVYLNSQLGSLRYVGQQAFPIMPMDPGPASATLLHDFDGDGIADLVSWPGNGWSSQFNNDLTFYYYRGTALLTDDFMFDDGFE